LLRANNNSKTSGAASVQMMFSEFVTLPCDPYYKPKTAADLAQHDRHQPGQIAPDTARLLADAVRRRKGLFVEEQTIDADKQRTLSKTK
jgi:hypothetical protein